MEYGGQEETEQRSRFRELYVQSITQGVDPQSPDYLNFYREGAQPLVDAAFLAHAFLRARHRIFTAWFSAGNTLLAGCGSAMDLPKNI